MKTSLVGALAATLLACGGTTAGDIDGGASDAGSKPDAVGQPPPPPTTDSGTTPPPPPNTTTTFALQTLHLGEADRSGIVSNTAWKAYGFNLDNLVTDKTSTNVCTLYNGAPKTNQTDGNNGIDNAWGETLVPILQAATSDETPSQTESGYVDQGLWTVQLQITGLSNDTTQSATGLGAQIFASGQYDNGTPSFDSSTDWPVLSTSVVDGKTLASGSTAQYKTAYITNGTFVSGPGPDPLVLDLNVANVPFELEVHDAIITFAHTSQTGITNGTIAGVLDAQELETTLAAVAGQFSTALCGSAFGGIAQQISQAADILDDGTNVQGKPCTGISFALGFDAVEVANPTKVADPGPPPPDPCQ
jgi:hypothetical protein